MLATAAPAGELVARRPSERLATLSTAAETPAAVFVCLPLEHLVLLVAEPPKNLIVRASPSRLGGRRYSHERSAARSLDRVAVLEIQESDD
ncbi:MAG: hypothetical protein ACRDZ6_10640 [Acidimicrobiales bacterium]